MTYSARDGLVCPSLLELVFLSWLDWQHLELLCAIEVPDHHSASLKAREHSIVAGPLRPTSPFLLPGVFSSSSFSNSDQLEG